MSHQQIQSSQPAVAGVQVSSDPSRSRRAEADPNHPTEIYYGGAIFWTLKDMTYDLGIIIYSEDKIEVFPEPEWGLGSKITIQRALPIAVDDAGKVKTLRTWQKQISDFLTEQNIVLGDKDKITPDQNTWLRPGLQVAITRVAETEIKEEEVIPFRTINRNDSNLEKGKTRVEAAGKNGKKVKTFLVRRENGEEVSRNLLHEEVISQAEDRIVFVGTKVIEIGRGTASWYDWISGNAAAHNTLPMGTMVRVTNLENGKSVVVKIVDRGIQTSAIIDLSADAFSQIAPLGQGLVPVRLTRE